MSMNAKYKSISVPAPEKRLRQISKESAKDRGLLIKILAIAGTAVFLAGVGTANHFRADKPETLYVDLLRNQ